MELSEARINTNRNNASKSTGPKSISGKSRSSKNALTHGFRAEVHSIEDPEAVRVRAEAIAPPSRIGAAGLDPLGDWVAGQVATLSLRIERCQASELAARERIVARAEITWDEDRRLAATVLGGTIAKRPEEVSARLRESYHGCGWLISRWAMLAHSADIQHGFWTPDQARLAFDLLGTPAEFREGRQPGEALDRQARLPGPIEGTAGLARRQITSLIELQDRLAPLDAADRERAKADLSDHSDPELRKLRRYEASLQRRLEWSIALLQELSTPQPTAPIPDPEPEPEPEAEPEPEPEAEPEPSDKPEPSRVGPPSRAEKKLIRAEAHREARRRKLDGRRN
jgi:hypothetical protein